ncbi:hypothetical protein EB061_01135 [bacterium]|nr:hypothetical protein [bacterium]
MSESDVSQSAGEPPEKPSFWSTSKATAQRVGVFVGVGAAVGLAVVSILFPRLMLWYFKPPVTNGWASCGPSVEWAIRIYQRLEWGRSLSAALRGFGVTSGSAAKSSRTMGTAAKIIF